MQSLDPTYLSKNADMRKYTSLQIGGPADFLLDIHSEEEIRAALHYAKAKDLPVLVIGKGSNILVGDAGIRGLVLRIAGGFAEIKQTAPLAIYARSGCSMKALSKFAEELSLAGLSFASGIPGTVGGGVMMNAGAYGAELKDVVEFVDVMDENGIKHRFSNADMQFAYRSSRLQNSKYIVLGVSFQLKAGNKEEIAALTQDLNRRRADKQPLHLPSCGSVFKRPMGNYASALIEQCGLKGFRLGHCAVSDKHSGFLVNDQGATAKEYLALIHYVQDVVKKETNYDLEMEVKAVGEFL